MRRCDRPGRMQLKTSLLVANIIFEGTEWGKALSSKSLVSPSRVFFFKGQADRTRHIMLVISDFWLEVV